MKKKAFILAVITVCTVLAGCYSQTENAAATENAIEAVLEEAKASISSAEEVSDYTWYVPYYTALNAAEPDINGNVTMWDYGYFKVYWWSDEGIMLASRPQYVVVDGCTYEYVGSECFTEYSWELIEKVRCNNGIAFETCGVNEYIGTVYYYEPVSEGYAEYVGESAVLETSEEVSDYSNYKDVWYVAYYDAWGAEEADENGAVTQWDYAYFTAHRWSRQGVMIASMPEYVVVDGIMYEYVSHWYSDYADTSSYNWNVILRARANGGIVFQTCTTPSESDCETGILLVHYEPINSDGYTEHEGESQIICDFDEL